jgi:2-methylcitrate dehydratase PrpD
LRAQHGFTEADVDRIEVDVDPIVPTILIYDRPSGALEAKFSLPFCAAAAVVFGRVGIDTFDASLSADRDVVAALMPAVTMRVDEAIGQGKPALTEGARAGAVSRMGDRSAQEAHGARGYPANQATAEQLAAKFLACASRAIDKPRAAALLSRLATLDQLDSIREIFR